MGKTEYDGYEKLDALYKREGWGYFTMSYIQGVWSVRIYVGSPEYMWIYSEGTGDSREAAIDDALAKDPMPHPLSEEGRKEFAKG